MTEFGQLKSTLDKLTPKADKAAALQAVHLAKENFHARQGSTQQGRHKDNMTSWMTRLSMQTKPLKRTFTSSWCVAGSSSVTAAGLAVIMI